MSKGKRNLFKITKEKPSDQIKDALATVFGVKEEVTATQVTEDQAPVVEPLEVLSETPVPTVSGQDGVAHDIYFCKERRKWIHITIPYKKGDGKEESYGINQAIAMKKLHDLITNKMIAKRKGK